MNVPQNENDVVLAWQKSWWAGFSHSLGIATFNKDVTAFYLNFKENIVCLKQKYTAGSSNI